MKKKFNVYLVFVFILTLFFINGCSYAKSISKGNKKTVTVTTGFIKDMVKELSNDIFNIETIIPSGEDPHVYMAKPNDIIKITSADLILYHGLHFEGRMIDILSKKGVAVTKNFPKKSIGYMEENGEIIVDPHFWFDINLYKSAVDVVAEELIKLDKRHLKQIEANKISYLKKLDDLDKENRRLLSQIPEKSRKLVTPHDAFNYFSRAYNIEVKSPQGVSTEAEIATSDINETVDFIVKNNVKAVFVESTTDPARMEKLYEATKKRGAIIKVIGGDGNELFSDSLAEEGKEGDTYIGMYRHNIKLIVDNLK